MITTKKFWSGAFERAIKTFFQTFVAVVLIRLGGLAVGIDAGLQDVAWLSALSVAGLATLLSVATSIGNADFTAGDQQPAPAVPDTVVINQPEGSPAVELTSTNGAGRHRAPVEESSIEEIFEDHDGYRGETNA